MGEVVISDEDDRVEYELTSDADGNKIEAWRNRKTTRPFRAEGPCLIIYWGDTNKARHIKYYNDIELDNPHWDHGPAVQWYNEDGSLDQWFFHNRGEVFDNFQDWLEMRRKEGATEEQIAHYILQWS